MMAPYLRGDMTGRRLAPRECDVMEALIAYGSPYKQAAHSMTPPITERTFKNYLTQIRLKLNATNIHEAVVTYLRVYRRDLLEMK